VFELRIFLGRDARGRVRQKSATVHGTKRQAERELTRLVLEYGGKLPDNAESGTPWGEDTTINDAIEGWSQNGWQDLSPTTVRHCQDLWDRYIRGTIGTRRIAELNAYDVERYFRRLADEGTGSTTLRHIRGVLHRACRLARKWSGNTILNPVIDTELPAGKQSAEARVRAPEVDEVAALLDMALDYDLRVAAFIRLIAVTGARRGEACALRWSDIDEESSTIRIDEAIVAADGGAAVKAPKTRASVRTVAIDPETLALLRSVRIEQSKVAMACGLSLSTDAFVFSADASAAVPPYPDAMSRAFIRVRIKAGVAEDVHLHSLRHFHATVVDPVISEAQKQARLGWSTVRMARHYTDAIPAEDRRAAAHVAALLGDKRLRDSRPA
jgi:integrase